MRWEAGAAGAGRRKKRSSCSARSCLDGAVQPPILAVLVHRSLEESFSVIWEAKGGMEQQEKEEVRKLFTSPSSPWLTSLFPLRFAVTWTYSSLLELTRRKAKTGSD